MILLYFCVVHFFLQISGQRPYGDVENILLEFIKTGTKPTNLDNVLQEVLNADDTDEENETLCSVCRIVSNIVINARKDGLSKEVLSNFSKELCILLSDFGYETCSGYIDIIMDSILYIIDNKSDLTAMRVCAIRFQTNNCEDAAYIPWSIDIPPGKSVLLPKQNSNDKVNVIHLTDIHYDPLYEPRSEAMCNEILCCESTSGKAKYVENEAGFWGDYRACDMPWNAIEDLLKQIRKEHSKIDRVYFTGDIISHQVWNTTKEDNKVYITKMLQKLQDSFGEISVYPILGNHESHPTDFYPPTQVTDTEFSIEWLFRFLAEAWSRWLPTDTLKTIRKGGYYTVLVKPGFRIIALNSNVCFTYNLWLILDDKDPYGQLQWLSDTLLKAEKNKESVHILSHIPPGDSECLQQWSHEFRRIIERFHGIITAQFNGHTHLDELKVFFNSEDQDEVVNVAFNGGSFTTFIGFNPGYKIYQVENRYNRIIDYEQWTYNISTANEDPNNKPDWFKLYSFKNTYGFQPDNLERFHWLLQNMSKNFQLVEEYRRLQGRNSSIVINTNCNKKCLHDILCTMKSVEYSDLIVCQNQYDIKKVKIEL